MWGSGGRAPSAGRFFNENDIILGIFEHKFLLQNIFQSFLNDELLAAPINISPLNDVETIYGQGGAENIK